MLATEVTIHFEGKPLTCRGDTSVAVALWEQGIRLLSHSHKYGRPRGLHCARGHCTSCLLRVDGVPNVRSCLTRVRDGMRVTRQETGAFYGRTLQKVLDSGDTLFPVGFYFKWFTRPAALSRLFLKTLRPLAGIGRLPAPAHGKWQQADDPTTNRQSSADWGLFDEVIVGAGVSGLTAAAAATGRVLLVDDHPEIGGQRHGAFIELAKSSEEYLQQFPVLGTAAATLERAVSGLADRSDVTCSLGSRAVAGYDPDGLVLHDGSGLAFLRSRVLTWTAGALDVLGLFPGNDVPGLFGPRAIYRLLTRDGMDVKGQRSLVCGGGLDLWLCAALLHARGATVTLVLDEAGWTEEVGAAMDNGWPIHSGLRLASVRRRGDRDLAVYCLSAQAGQPPLELPCDLAVVCGRGKPAYDIPYQLGADLVLDPERGGYVPRGVEEERYRGRLAGGLELRVAGEAAGQAAAALLAGRGPGDGEADVS